MLQTYVCFNRLTRRCSFDGCGDNQEAWFCPAPQINAWSEVCGSSKVPKISAFAFCFGDGQVG